MPIWDRHSAAAVECLLKILRIMIDSNPNGEDTIPERREHNQ